MELREHGVGALAADGALRHELRGGNPVAVGTDVLVVGHERRHRLRQPLDEARSREPPIQLQPDRAVSKLLEITIRDQRHALGVGGVVDANAPGIGLGRDDPATRPGHPAHLADRGVRVLEVHQDPLDVDGVEARIREWQAVGVAGDELHALADARGLDPLSGRLQERRGIVEADHATLSADELRERGQERARTAADVEHAHPRLQAEQLERPCGDALEKRVAGELVEGRDHLPARLVVRRRLPDLGRDPAAILAHGSQWCAIARVS